MSRGLINKALLEVRTVTLLCGVAVMMFEWLIAFFIRAFSEEIPDEIARLFELEFFRNMLESLLGSDGSGGFGPEAMRALPWAHPIVLAILWAHAITICTRVPAGEVDRGTIDVLFGLPVSRWQLYASETVVWMAAGLVTVVLAGLGNVVGASALPPKLRLGPGSLLATIANLYCLYLAVGGISYLVSALSDRRGRAVATAFGIVLGSFFLNFLAQFWQPARDFAFLGILNYYRPYLILGQAEWPIADMLVLVASGGVAWLCGGIIFARRDICTV